MTGPSVHEVPGPIQVMYHPGMHAGSTGGKSSNNCQNRSRNNNTSSSSTGGHMHTITLLIHIIFNHSMYTNIQMNINHINSINRNLYFNNTGYF
jgi:hypothetical protein